MNRADIMAVPQDTLDRLYMGRATEGDQLLAHNAIIALTESLPPAGGFVVDGELPRVKAYHAALSAAQDALLEAHGIGGPARERAADEACRYFVNHFSDMIAPRLATTAQPSAKDGERKHDYSDDNGRRCIVCGASDWETGGVCPGAKDGVRDAARALIERLRMIHTHPDYEAVWFCAQNHIGAYAGPKYDKELSALEAAIGREVVG